MVVRSWFVLAVLVTLLVASEAVADCDPLTFHDKTIAFSDTQTRLLYAQDITQNRQSASSSSGGLDFFDIVQLDGRARSTYLDELKKSTNIDFQQSDRTYLYLSAMSDNEVKAYLGCLQASDKNIFLVPSNNSATSPIFGITVSLRSSLAEPSVPVSIDLSGGTINRVTPSDNWTIDANKTGATGQMKLGSQIGVAVTRQAAKPFEMIITAGSQTEIMSFPAPPTVKLVEEIRYSPTIESRCDLCNNESVQNATLAINLPDDELIIPRSENVEIYVSGSSPGYSPHNGPLYGTLNLDAYSNVYRLHDLYVPISVSTTAPTKWCGKWLASVKAYVPVPIGTNSSGRQGPKPSITCVRPN
jgi:hypothetical protein